MFPDLLQDGDPILLVVDINNDFFEPINIWGAEGRGRDRGPHSRHDLSSRSGGVVRSHEFRSHPLNSREVTRVFGVPLGVP